MSGPSPVEPPQTVAASSAFSYSTVLKTKSEESRPPRPIVRVVPDEAPVRPPPKAAEESVVVSPPRHTILSSGLTELDAMFDGIEREMEKEEFVPPTRSAEDLKVYDVVSVVEDDDWELELDAVDPKLCPDEDTGVNRAQLEEAANALSKKELKQFILKKAPASWTESTDIRQRRRTKRELVALKIAVDLEDEAMFRRQIESEVGLDDFIGGGAESTTKGQSGTNAKVSEGTETKPEELPAVERGWIASTGKAKQVDFVPQVADDIGGINPFDSGIDRHGDDAELDASAEQAPPATPPSA
jgi:hypothetical protein